MEIDIGSDRYKALDFKLQTLQQLKNDLSYSPQFLGFEFEPPWLLHFLALFNCDSIPKIIFTRASQTSIQWNPAGELVRVNLNYLHLVHPSFEELLGQASWEEILTDFEERRLRLEHFVERSDPAMDGLQLVTRDSQITVLIIVASAFPEPVCTILFTKRGSPLILFPHVTLPEQLYHLCERL